MAANSLALHLEKERLCSSIFGIFKVAQTNTDEPIALLLTQIYSLAQFQRDLGQFLAGGGRRTWREAACKNLEITGLQFQNHRAC